VLRQGSRLDPEQTGYGGWRRPERVEAGSPRHRRYRAGVECLEDRRLLSAITQFPLPTPYLDPVALTAGPDGNLWFTNYNWGTNTGGIGRITTSGAVTDFPLPSPSDHPGGLTVGPDGNLWFTYGSNGTGGIGRVTPAGAITVFPLPADHLPYSVTVGSDGNIWFPEDRYDGTIGIGRITPSGTITEFSQPFAGAGSSMFISQPTVGPDGAIWFGVGSYIEGGHAPVPGPSAIGRITPSGIITQFPAFPGTLTVGPDGNLWFNAGTQIGRMTPSGSITEFPLPTTGVYAIALTVGPDGNLWFPEDRSDGGTSQIGRITPSGTITEFPLPVAGFEPNVLTVGPDGNLWFGAADVGAAQSEIDRITPSGAVTEFAASATGARVGSPFSFTVLTVGPNGNLWFPESNAGSIGEINPSSPGVAQSPPGVTPWPPRVTGFADVHSRARITEIVLSFSEALDPGTAGKLGFYHLAAGVKTRHALVFSKALKIARVLYDGSTHQVTLKLTKAHKGVVQVTVGPGIMAADGIPSFNTFTTDIS
jgi:streptogramin lyase